MLQLNAIRSTWPLAALFPACLLLLTIQSIGLAQVDPDCVQIERRLPPEGLALPREQVDAWNARLQELQSSLASVEQAQFKADVGVLLKACRYAIEHRELYQERDFAKVDRLLGVAARRIDELRSGTASWSTGSGRQVRGFQSEVDGSLQPVGLILPEDWRAASNSIPLYVWLHGRGDQATDLHFLCERLDKDGQIIPPGAIVLHPFGRQCVGYKSAGETDVLEAIDFVCENYPIDRERIVLMGFSMGGAGVWHLAAHYGERFVAASSGAGFAETARYQGLRPDNYPPLYEQMLWRIYDVPGYTRNLFNLDFVAYSGELDKQIQAAQVMEEAFQSEGRTLPHLIGPGMGHKYHPDTLGEILSRMQRAAEQGRPAAPDRFYLQSQHPRYASRSWLHIDGFEQQYQDTRVDAIRSDDGWELTTKNASRLKLQRDLQGAPQASITVDGTRIALPTGPSTTLLARDSGLVPEAASWKIAESFPLIRKRPGISGPIDDAFIDPFLVVVPSGSSISPQVDRWVRCELDNFTCRWRELFRGDVRVKRDVDVTQADLAQFHVVVWGTPESNSLMKKIFDAGRQQSWPLQWSSEQIAVGANQVDANSHAMLAIYPNPLAPDRYVVLNSGPTFRQAHDRTNSLQNPHLPDWVLLSLDELPSAESPGGIRHTGFFNDAWTVEPQLTW